MAEFDEIAYDAAHTLFNEAKRIRRSLPSLIDQVNDSLDLLTAANVAGDKVTGGGNGTEERTIDAIEKHGDLLAKLHDDEAHYVAYTERDEHGSVTRTGLHLGREKMLLHRDGAVCMKALFDPGATTRADYNAAGLGAQFAVRTRQYDVFFDERRITVDLRYALAENNDDPGADFELKIEIEDA